MNGYIKVSTEKLISTASEFSAKGKTASTLTSQMSELAKGLSSVWTGDAATAYQNKFTSLNDDIQRMNNMIQEHATDLQEMAKIYSDAEQASKEEAAQLASDVIS